MPTLLLSDDSAAVQRLIAMTFSDRDILVVSVADGEEAIARITALRPDIVLASIGTPRRSGYDVAAHVKSTPALAAIPVLLIAAAFEPVDHVRAAQVRCDGVLVKPLEPLQLVSRVNALLQAGPLPAPPPAAAPPPPAVVTLSAASEPGAVDEFFERLDAAFARRAAARPAPPSDDVGTVPTLDSVLRPGVPTAMPTGVASTVEPVATDALVDEVTRRVIDRFGMATLRDVVKDVVAETAERLIREEIGRIRNQP